jgi:hypothetical protein
VRVVHRMNRACAPSFEGLPTGVTDDFDLIEVIHAGAAEGAVAGGKTRGLDHVRLEAEAGGETKNRARVLGDIGLIKRNAHRQDCRHAANRDGGRNL